MENQSYLAVSEERTPKTKISKASSTDQGFTEYASRYSINPLKERRFQKGMEELLEAHQREKDAQQIRKSYKRGREHITQFSSEVDSLQSSTLRSSFILENRNATTFKLEKSPKALRRLPPRSKSHIGGTKYSLYKKQSLYAIKTQSPDNEAPKPQRGSAQNNDSRSDSTFLPDNFTFIPKMGHRRLSPAKARLRDFTPSRRCLVLPDNPWKLKWNYFLACVVWASSIFTPLHVAFYEEFSEYWSIFEGFVNLVFLVDIVLTFVAAYHDRYEMLVTNPKRIALSYLKGWFFVDLVAILPLQLVSGSLANQLGKMVRLPRIQNLIRSAKLFSSSRILKAKKETQKQISRISGSSLQSQRLISFSLLFVVLCHTLACGWILIARLQDFDHTTWVAQHDYQNSPAIQKYMAGLYLIVATITTVGYGDITAGHNPIEQAFAVALMVIGALSYSAAISTFMSLMSEMDQKAQKLRHKLETLARIKDQFNLDFQLYWRLRRSLHFDHQVDMGERNQLLNELPAHLKVELTNIMYSNQLASIDFFKRKSPKFIATVAPLLKPLKVCKGEHIYLQGDSLDGIYFIKSGEAAYVEPRGEADLTFAHIYAGSFFGDVDFTASTHMSESKRLFSVKALSDMDLLLLSKEDLFDIDIEFKNQVFKLFNKSHRKAEKLNRILTRGHQWLQLQQLSKQSPSHYSRNLSLPQKPAKKKIEHQQEQTTPTLQESQINIEPVCKRQPLKRQITFHRRKSVRKALDRQLTLSSAYHSEVNNNSKQFLDIDSSSQFLLGDSFLSQQSSKISKKGQSSRRPSQFLKDLDKLDFMEERKSEENQEIERDIPEHFSYSSSSSSSNSESEGAERSERQSTVKRKDGIISMLSYYE